jgi:tetratricopeptide (TPR) repeat protein
MEARGLSDMEIAVTGRLASMTRREGAARIAEAGGVYVREPGEGTGLLVVGQAGWPLKDDGKPTQSLVKGRRLQKSGTSLRIIMETEFLSLLGLKDLLEDLNGLYTTSQLSRILGIPASRIRYWTRCRLITPLRLEGRLGWFDFKEVLSARALNQLTSSGVGPSRIKKSLQELSRWLPDTDRMLMQLETFEEGRLLRVRLENGELALPDGQMLFDFASKGKDGERATVKSMRPAPDARHKHAQHADHWFDQGVEAEDRGDLQGALRAYGQALKTGEAQPEILFNIGNVLYGLKQQSDAVECYCQAIELDPDYLEAWNNLGIVLGEMGRYEEAIRAYDRALLINRHYVDAHFNLAGTLEQIGLLAEARMHWEACLKENPHSTWAKEISKHLQ